MYGESCGLNGGMLETSECFGYVSRHQQIDCFVFVVPIQVDAAIELTLPVNVDFVILLESLFQVFGMGQVNGFDPKIVYHKAEDDWVPNMMPKTRGVLTVIVSLEVEPFFKEFVG